MFLNPSYDKNIRFRIRGFSKNYILNFTSLTFLLDYFNFLYQEKTGVETFTAAAAVLFSSCAVKTLTNLWMDVYRFFFYLFTDALISCQRYSNKKNIFTPLVFFILCAYLVWIFFAIFHDQNNTITGPKNWFFSYEMSSFHKTLYFSVNFT